MVWGESSGWLGFTRTKCTNVAPNFLYLTLIYINLFGMFDSKTNILINYEKLGKLILHGRMKAN